MNPGTFAVSAVLIIIVCLIIYKMIKDKKSGKSTCSCGGSCSGCGMAGSCHKTSKPELSFAKSSENVSNSDPSTHVSDTGSIQIEDRNVIKKITLQIDGMMCGMCESHINDAIRSKLNVNKLKTSHVAGTSEFLTNDVVSDDTLRDIVEKTGYRLTGITRSFQ